MYRGGAALLRRFHYKNTTDAPGSEDPSQERRDFAGDGKPVGLELRRSANREEATHVVSIDVNAVLASLLVFFVADAREVTGLEF